MNDRIVADPCRRRCAGFVVFGQGTRLAQRALNCAPAAERAYAAAYHLRIARIEYEYGHAPGNPPGE